MKKYLYCTKCKEYPNEIEQRYEGRMIEYRKWGGDCYELQSSNLDELDWNYSRVSHCFNCKKILLERA